MNVKRFLTGLIVLILALCLLPADTARGDGPEDDGDTVAVEGYVQATLTDRAQGSMIDAPKTQATAGPTEAEATEQSSVMIWIARGLGALMAAAVILVMHRKRKSVYRKRK
jgi:hypothetical protein